MNTKTVYIAEDGKEFYNEQECRYHEGNINAKKKKEEEMQKDLIKLRDLQKTYYKELDDFMKKYNGFPINSSDYRSLFGNYMFF